MVTTTAPGDDPIRDEVERWLHAIVGVTFALPLAVATRARRCVRRSAGGVRERLARPARLAKSLFDLAGTRVPGELAPIDARSDHAGGPAGPAVRRGPSATAGELPIEEYESLAASQVVARLPSLTPAELDAIRHFEANHRGRRTVIGKIDQLLAPT